MAYMCENCGRHSYRGRQHTHHTGVAGGQWKKRAQTTGRIFRANLHWISLPVDGKMKRMRLCTDCSGRIKFDNKQNDKSNKLTNEKSAASLKVLQAA